jgi:hypothetical protein
MHAYAAQCCHAEAESMGTCQEGTAQPGFAAQEQQCLIKAGAQFPYLNKAAVRLLSMHASTAAAERNWSAWGRVYTSLRNRLSLETAEKMVYVKANMTSSAATEDSMITLDHMVVNA